MYGMEETNYVLFKLFGMDVTSYAFFLTLGVALGIVMAAVRARKMRLSWDLPLTFGIIGIPMAVVFARAVFCLCRMVDVLDYGFEYVLHIEYGGFSLMGAAVGALLAGAITAKIHHVSFKRVMDCTVPGMLMALALARFAEGATFNGKGLEVMLSEGLQFFPIAAEGLFGEKVYAVYMGEGLTALIAAVWAQSQYYDHEGKKRPDGYAAVMGVLIVAAAQFMWECARRDDLLKSGFVRYQMVFAGAIMIILMFLSTFKNGYSVRRKVITWVVFALCIGMNVFTEFLVDGKVIQEVPIWLCFAIHTVCAATEGVLTAKSVGCAMKNTQA